VPIARKIVQGGGSVLFSTYLEGVNYVKEHGFSVVKAPDISLSSDHTGAVSLKLTTVEMGLSAITIFLRQLSFEIKHMQAFKPDLVFSDTRLSSIYASRLLGIPCVVMLNQFLPRVPRQNDNIGYMILDGGTLTLLGWSWELADAIIIPDFPFPYTISIDSLRIPKRYHGKVRLVGTILSSKPQDVVDSESVRKSLGVKERQTLVYAGISGPKVERTPLIGLLQDVFKGFPNEYRIVMSLGDAGGGDTPIVDNNLIMIPWMTNRWHYLKACDVIVSRGGHETIMQSIAYGKPAVIIPVPNHPEQYGNARRVKQFGVADALHQRDVNTETLLEAVNRMKSNEKQQKLRKINEEIELGDGVENTLNVLSEFLG
jgi:UDP:flavonoid glycosyltransferase YjiC (YdhE family)